MRLSAGDIAANCARERYDCCRRGDQRLFVERVGGDKRLLTPVAHLLVITQVEPVERDLDHECDRPGRAAIIELGERRLQTVVRVRVAP